MHRDLENLWLTRDAVGLLIVHPALSPLQKRMHRARHVRVHGIVERLTEAKQLDAKIEERLTLLRQQIITQLFFWILLQSSLYPIATWRPASTGVGPRKPRSHDPTNAGRRVCRL